MKRNGGRLEPEARLQVVWVAEPFIIAGLVLIGFGLEKHMTYWIPGVGYGLFSFGVMLCSVGVNAYNLDAYSEGSGEVAAWLNFSRTTGGFVSLCYFLRKQSTTGCVLVPPRSITTSHNYIYSDLITETSNLLNPKYSPRQTISPSHQSSPSHPSRKPDTTPTNSLSPRS